MRVRGLPKEDMDALVEALATAARIADRAQVSAEEAEAMKGSQAVWHAVIAAQMLQSRMPYTLALALFVRAGVDAITAAHREMMKCAN